MHHIAMPRRPLRHRTVLVAAILLVATLGAHAATPTYAPPTLLARTTSSSAWRAKPGDDLTRTRLALGDDGGAMVIVDHGDPQPWGYYLYDPRGAWRSLFDGRVIGIPGQPTAGADGYFTLSVGYHASNLVEAGVYTLDTRAGYASAQPTRFPTGPVASFVPIHWDYARRLPDGRVAYSADGFAGAGSTGSIWAIAASDGSASQVVARTKSVDASSPYTQLCTPTVDVAQGFFGCVHAPQQATADHALRAWLSGLTLLDGVMDTGHAGGLDAWGDLAYADPQYSTPAIFCWTQEIGDTSHSSGQLFYGADDGFDAILADSPVSIVRPLQQPTIEIVFEAHLDTGGEALVAILADADGTNAHLVRLIGRDDPVRLEDGRLGHIGVLTTGSALGSQFAVNARGDILLTADLYVSVGLLDEHVAAGTGLILLERELFRDGFDD